LGDDGSQISLANFRRPLRTGTAFIADFIQVEGRGSSVSG
jgi:hypothetical protein